MKTPALRFAMRETHDLLRSRLAWLFMGGVGLMLAVAGPFDTINLLSLPERLVYWPLTVVLTFVTGWFIEAIVSRRRWFARQRRALRAVIAGCAIGAAVWVEILVLNGLFFGPVFFEDRAELVTLLRDIVLIATIVVGLLIFAGPLDRPAEGEGSAPGTAAVHPRLLARLPLDKRGVLVSLSVQDHYTEVTTTAGRVLILLRLSDAIAETEGVRGLQIHRSHWVALAHVAQVRRDGTRASLTLKDGRVLPISRTFVPDAKKAGLL